MKNFFHSRAGKILSVLMSVLALGSCFMLTAFAADGDAAGQTVVQMTPDQSISAAKGLFAEVTGTLNFANIAKVLSIGIGAAIGIWLAWWGIRKLIKVITKALNGRLSLN